MKVNQTVQVGDEPHKTLAKIEQIQPGGYVIARWIGLDRPPFLVHQSQLSLPGRKSARLGGSRSGHKGQNYWVSAKLGFTTRGRKSDMPGGERAEN